MAGDGLRTASPNTGRELPVCGVIQEHQTRLYLFTLIPQPTCRQMASEALRLSGAATGESKHRYEHLANAWLELAADIERAHGLRAGPLVNGTVQICTRGHGAPARYRQPTNLGYHSQVTTPYCPARGPEAPTNRNFSEASGRKAPVVTPVQLPPAVSLRLRLRGQDNSRTTNCDFQRANGHRGRSTLDYRPRGARMCRSSPGIQGNR